MSKVMSAHQPNFLPYLGFFDKLRAVDELGSEPGVFVIREDCQYVESDFHNRNKIRINDGWIWLNVPIEKKMAPLSAIRIKKDARIKNVPWNQYHLRQIEANYKKSPFFEKFFPGLKEIYENPGESLAEFNLRLIRYLAESFGIKAKIILFSELQGDISSTCATRALIDISRAVGAVIYLSGDGGRCYMDLGLFKDVEVRFQDYKHPVYPQRFPGFEPYMSAIDALFNLGRLPASGEIIG
ncbi:MAG: WbqC family protein [Candidatus Aenigmarchaeota archaeon]|nr:WbqC family protein [Candidatus Aenigmarchaeota archaeon]